MTPKVRFINHACHTVETEDSYVLVDPWLEGRVFNESWALLRDTDLSEIDFGRLTHVVISHEHPDHLHFPSLKKIRELASGDVAVLMPRRNNHNVLENVTKMGFKFAYLEPFATYSLDPILSITQAPSGMDAALIFTIGDKVLLNQNDCKLDDTAVNIIRQAFPKIDAWMMQFSLAGYYGNRDDRERLRKRGQEGHLQLIQKYYQAFSPSFWVPFASFVYFCKKYNQYLNEWVVTPDMVKESFPNMPLQALFYGDELKWEISNHKNAQVLERYREIYSDEKIIVEGRDVSSDDMRNAIHSFLEKLSSSSRHGPPETHLIVKDKEWNISVDIRGRKIELINETDPAKLGGALPSDELACLLRFPWGADTLNIAATFDVHNSDRWYGLMGFMGSLYIR